MSGWEGQTEGLNVDRREVTPAPLSQINFSKPERTAGQLKDIPEVASLKAWTSIEFSVIKFIFSHIYH